MPPDPPDPSSGVQVLTTTSTPPTPESPPPKQKTPKMPGWLAPMFLAIQKVRDLTVLGIVLAVLGIVVSIVVWIVPNSHTLQQEANAATQSAQQHEEDKQWQKEVLDRLAKVEASKEQSLAGGGGGGGKQNREEIRAEVYAELEKQYGLPAGTIAHKLPEFAKKIKDDPASSLLEQANAAYALEHFDEAETFFLESAEQENKQRTAQMIASYEKAGWAAEKTFRYEAAIEHFRKAAQYTDQKQRPVRWAEIEYALAYALSDARRYGEAEEILRRVVRQQEESLGAKNIETLVSRSKLGNVLKSQGKYDEAEAEHRVVLQLREEVLGTIHPATLDSYNSLCGVLYARGKYAEAEAAYQVLLKLKEKVLGAKNPSTLAGRYNLARAIQEQGHYAQAEAEYRAVLKLQEEVLGAKHPDTLATRNNLAVTLYCQNKHAEAEAECQAVLKFKEEVLGKDHPSTLKTRELLKAIEEK
ncbi:MAG: tetratricopeptide repeat protein [Phycisphaerales bacterium]|nr:tetratricopeptide repeat protein [Phycisphaerales bacterium]